MKIYSSYRTKQTVRKARWIPSRRIGIVVLAATTILLFLLKVATWLNAQELFLLKNLAVEGNRMLNKSEILSLVTLDTSITLLDYDIKKVADEVQRHPLIAKAWVRRKLPSTLVIKVEERHPLAILNDSELMAIDEHGKSMAISRTEMLFDVPIISNLRGQENQDALGRVLSFLSATKSKHFNLYCEISEISYSHNFGIYFYLNDRAIPVIWGTADAGKKSNDFMDVLAVVKNRGELSKVKYFDARFKNQIILREARS